MDQSDRKAANDLATQIATTEMIRILIANLCRGETDAESKGKLAKFEQLVVDGLTNRRHFPQADDATENYIKEAASGYVSRVVAGINAK